MLGKGLMPCDGWPGRRRHDALRPVQRVCTLRHLNSHPPALPQVRLGFQRFQHAFNTNYTLYTFATTVGGRSRASSGVRFLTSP